jgi:hypothetical protein
MGAFGRALIRLMWYREQQTGGLVVSAGTSCVPGVPGTKASAVKLIIARRNGSRRHDILTGHFPVASYFLAGPLVPIDR